MSDVRIKRGGDALAAFPPAPENTLRPAAAISRPSTAPLLSLPWVEAGLVEHLDRVFPLAVCPTLDDYRRMEGRREVIDHLAAILKEQSQ